MTPKKFAPAFYFKKPTEKAPSFVIGNVSIKVGEFVEFLEQNVNDAGYINLVVKESIKGTIYAEIDTWVPKKADELQSPIHGTGDPLDGDINPDDVPF
jgi:hypothetical protein